MDDALAIHDCARAGLIAFRAESRGSLRSRSDITHRGQDLLGEDLQRAHDLGLRQRTEVDQEADLRDADVAQHCARSPALVRP